MELYYRTMIPELYKHILFYFDGDTTLNALCVPDIYHQVSTIDLVRGLSRRTVAKTDSFTFRHLNRIPSSHVVCYIRMCIDLGADVCGG